jgi:hypothetical protein
MDLLTETPVKTCRSCGNSFTEAQSSGRDCFKCKVNTVGFSWRGPTRASKQNFHDYTIREAIEEGNRGIEATGSKVSDFEHVGTRWV